MAKDKKNYPEGWESFDDHARHLNKDAAEIFNFKSEIGDINRFANRFRAAKSFKEVILDDYSSKTVNGYSALFKVMFTWSAFETFLEILDLKQKDNELVQLLNKYKVKNLITKIKTIEQHELLFNFIREKLERENQKKELDKCLENDPSCNITYLASGIRHIFSHGWLTPNANGIDPDVTGKICNELSDFLLKVMNTEFSNHIEKGLKEIYSF